MPTLPLQIDAPLSRLDQLLQTLAVSPAIAPAIERWRSDAAALRFHCHPLRPGAPLLAAVIGGTGTGKSTLVNRLLGVAASATSFRRTYTAGAVAVARDPADIPPQWLSVPHATVRRERLPARGEIGKLAVIPRALLPQAPGADALLARVVLTDTPDLDGDQPAHHAEADRAFRWAQLLIFLVTPEKYQMTELLPYYRLASRYATRTLFVMNKCEEQVVVEDYRLQVRAAGFGADAPTSGAAPDDPNQIRLPPIYTIARDDAAFTAPAEENLDALRAAIIAVDGAGEGEVAAGLRHRAVDVVGRLQDQVLTPLADQRREATRLMTALREMETPAPGVDVNPVTMDLERRLQQRSVLYLMGPQRVLDRVRQAPAALVRLPRAAWDYLMHGEVARGVGADRAAAPRQAPDFPALLAEQFQVLQSRIDDLLGASPVAQKWVLAGGNDYQAARLSPDRAANIAREELDDLRDWLERRWNATPRDTKAVQSLLKFLPGGSKLTAVAESAPYLLVVALIAHHALFGTDLLVLGGYTLATWLTERLSNEVAGRTRTANVRIADRFTRLAHEQIQKLLGWVDSQAVSPKLLDQLEHAAGQLAAAAGMVDD